MKQLLFKSKILIASLSVVVTVGIVAVVVMLVSKDDEAYRTIKVIETVGEVNVLKENEKYAAYSGMILEEGYELTTGEESYVRLILDDDKYVKVEEGSKIVFETLGLFGTNKTKIRIEEGAMTCEITKPLEEEDDFVINTPNAVLAVRGTFFRVDLNFYDDDLVKTNVTTYGGIVATQRVLSTGVYVGDEVNVNAGNRVIISQINESEDVEDFKENVIYETQSITIEDIPDEDLIDVYFAVENGHDMFVDKEAIQEALDIRDINIEEHISVYEKAEKVKETYAEDTKEKETTTEEVTTEETTTEETTTEEAIEETATKVEEITTTVEEQTTKQEETTTIVEETTTVIVETTTQEKATEETTTKQEETTTEEPTTVHNHTEIDGGEAGIHKKCSECGEVIEDGTKHSYTSQVTKAATCTSKGEMTYTCTCGYKYTEEIDYLDHSSVDGGEEAIHAKCGSCGEVLENGSFHNYDIQVTKNPSCTEFGVRTYSCECGYSYTENIDKESHTEVGGGEAAVHKKCGICGEVIEDGTKHSYTSQVTKAATCTSKGEMTYTCTCGYKYIEEIDYLDHSSVDGGEEAIHAKCGSCGEVLENGSFHNYDIQVTKNPSCSEFGVRTYTCDCNYSYTESIAKEDHEEVGGGEATVHKKCNVCGEVIEDGTHHTLVKEETKAATCTEAGINTYSCNCGYSYTENVSALGHTKADASASTTTCKICGEPWVDISEANFEDTTFRTKLGQFDTNNDGCLIGEELTGITSVSVAGTTAMDGECKNLNGIELLPNVTQIDCSYNADLLALDFSGNTKLYKLYCNNTGVQTIDISGCTGLSTFDFTNCNELTEMDVSGTTLTSLIINSNPALTTLNVDGNRYSNITISGTQIASLELNDVTVTSTLKVLDTPVKTVQISNSSISTLNLAAISQLESLVTTNTTIASVTVSSCSGLKVLSIPDTGASVDFSDAYNIETLNLKGTRVDSTFELPGTIYAQLTSLNVSDCSTLNQLYVTECSNLISIDASGSTNLTYVDASKSGISSIDLTGCTNLTGLNLNSTKITTMANVIVSSDCNISSLDIGLQASDDINCVFNTSDIAWFDSLTGLYIENAKLSDTDWQNIKSSLSTDNLSRLKLTGNNSANAGASGEYLTKLDLSGFRNLWHQLEVSGLADVTEIDISDSAINSLPLYEFTNLVTLNAANSSLMELNANMNVELKTIDVSNCTTLDYIKLNNAMMGYKLETIDMTGCSTLTNVVLLECENITGLDFSDATSLTSVGLSGCTGITSIDLSNTKVETLDLSLCTGLTSAKCVNVTGNTNGTQTLEVNILGTSITEDIFEKSDGFTITLVTQ